MAATSPLSSARRELRAATAFAPGRPAYAAGIRAALAVVVPLVAGMLLGVQSGLWMSMAALHGIHADRGGAYQTRAATLAAVACASAAVAVVATVAGGNLAIVVPLAFLVAGGSGMSRAWGTSERSEGVPVLLTFLVALALPSSGAGSGAAVERAAFILIGGGWGMLLTLGLWPLRPDRPARQAVAYCYRELAAYVADIRRRIAAGEPFGADRLAGHATAVRRAVEHARAILASTRRGRPAETERGARLLELHEIADRCFVHAAAIAETVESVAPSEREAAGQDELTARFAEVASTLHALADAIEAERDAHPVPVIWRGATLLTIASASGAGRGAVLFAHVGLLLDRMARLAATASDLAAGLEAGGRDRRSEREPTNGRRSGAPGALATLRAALAPGSLVLRFSLQLGLVTAAAVALTALLDLRYGHWITITAAVVLQPYTGATTQRAVQRTLGTVLGGTLAAGLSAFFHDPTAIVVMIAVFVALSTALRPLSYAAFSVFVTPAFVLLVEVAVGDWGLAGVRVLNTVIGGALALAAARLFWPEPEWSRFPAYAATAMLACQRYLHVVSAVVTAAPEVASKPSMSDARRDLGLAAINAEESFQRLLGEHRGSAAGLEPAMAILDYIRHLANAVAALALARHSPEPRRDEEVTLVATMAGAVLEDLAAALVQGRPPAPLPESSLLGGPPSSSLHRVNLERILEQLEALHHAATRWSAPDVGTTVSSASRRNRRDPPEPPVKAATPTPQVLRDR